MVCGTENNNTGSIWISMKLVLQKKVTLLVQGKKLIEKAK